MNARIDQLFDEACLLELQERSQLALALLDSVEGEPFDEAAAEREAIHEAHRRLDMIATGMMKTIPWAEARA
jgi:Putative addiction module component